MICPSFHPAWTTNGVDRTAQASLFERRIRQLGAHYGDRLAQWDVVNESVDRSCTMAGPFHDRVCRGNPRIQVPDDYTFRSYKWEEEAFPGDVKLVVNDSWREIYVPFVKSLIDRGAKIDVVGFFFGRRRPPPWGWCGLSFCFFEPHGLPLFFADPLDIAICVPAAVDN